MKVIELDRLEEVLRRETTVVDPEDVEPLMRVIRCVARDVAAENKVLDRVRDILDEDSRIKRLREVVKGG